MSTSVLEIILQRAQSADPAQALQLFLDLDSTLFTVKHRTQHLLRQFAQDFGHRFPEHAEALQKIEVIDGDWGIRTTLQRAGIAFSPDFARQVREYWRQGFFSGEHLHLDQPYPGAVEFVQAADRAGAQIFYLTGRDRARMGEGTLLSLRHHRFPIGRPEHQLLMKPHLEMTDADFKESVFRQIDGVHKEVWVIENEPVILHRLLNAKFRLELVFMDSVHSGRAHPPTGIHVMPPDFRLGRR